uniref:Large ribosomal subunit protein mL54 n=1 Tax=Caenorhabditis japonica TaxID=281687 RepID=A0A8R1I2X7_CAEJA
MLRAVIIGNGKRLSLTFSRSYAPPKTAPAAAVKLDKSFVEEDAEKLATHVCINAYIQGDEPGPKILPDSEYPDWLFKLDLRPPREFEDLDPEKDGWLYWRSLRKRQIEQNRRIQNLKTKFLHLQNSPSMKK